MAILTDAKARNIKPTDKPLAHGGVPGLRLMPSKTKGQGRWEMRFVSPVTGKRRDAGLGSYPSVGLAEARDKAEAMRECIALGRDPLEDARTALVTKKESPTFEQAMDATLKVRRLTWKNEANASVRWLGRIQKHASPLLAMRVHDIEPEHIKAVLQPIWATQPDTARKLKTAIAQVLDWSEAHDYIKASPIPKALKQLGDFCTVATVHQPAMPYSHIPIFVDEHLYPADRVTQHLILFVILTAVRSANARFATWEQVDLKRKVWTIPAAAMKSKKNEGIALEVPLSSHALSILELMRGAHPVLIFPSPRKQVALSDMSTTSFLRTRNAPSDVAGRIATLHGFRASFKNWALEETDYADELSEAALGHAIGSRVRRAYARTSQLDFRRELMQKWSDFVMQKA
ncbi:integrase arm-type DNA-binding domain-containing protein [Chitinibacter fontanus]|uniref:Integrase arm-type DNA-binding domain-containing protein n=1 Tax=Chitinibacter fontanus TaxID=1737446 RepID=A0A7D5VAZ3_9NEIS|nr:integrase arm-type DNA-binding domain-containing protein [Chitinibacter fontanus]QLI82677.1 integrase arm-type DNA-binding domain-containing protein [Chitinibacter fontanus]